MRLGPRILGLIRLKTIAKRLGEKVQNQKYRFFAAGFLTQRVSLVRLEFRIG